jgi:hypothetical protein
MIKNDTKVKYTIALLIVLFTSAKQKTIDGYVPFGLLESTSYQTIGKFWSDKYPSTLKVLLVGTGRNYTKDIQ